MTHFSSLGRSGLLLVLTISVGLTGACSVGHGAATSLRDAPLGAAPAAGSYTRVSKSFQIGTNPYVHVDPPAANQSPQVDSATAMSEANADAMPGMPSGNPSEVEYGLFTDDTAQEAGPPPDQPQSTPDPRAIHKDEPAWVVIYRNVGPPPMNLGGPTHAAVSDPSVTTTILAGTYDNTIWIIMDADTGSLIGLYYQSLPQAS